MAASTGAVAAGLHETDRMRLEAEARDVEQVVADVVALVAGRLAPFTAPRPASIAPDNAPKRGIVAAYEATYSSLEKIRLMAAQIRDAVEAAEL